MTERHSDIPNAASNTCTWLCKDPTYQKWLNQSHGLFWIRGHPGVGKSTLMKHAFETDRSRSNGIFASFFFDSRGTLIQMSIIGLLRSLLYQISQQNSSVLLELTLIFKKKLQTDGEYGKDWTWHERELQKFFKTVVVKAANINTIRIFVDALDECGEQNATRLIGFFEGIADYLSICLSCRHYPLLTSQNGLEVYVEDKNAQDIASFVCYELNGNYEVFREEIIQRSAGNFQWANVVISLILNLTRTGCSLKAIQKRIRHIPQELSGLYESLLLCIPDEDIQQSLQLIQWIYFAKRPLSLTELRFAMAVGAKPSCTTISQCQETEYYIETDEGMEREVNRLSRGLAERFNYGEKQVVRFIHQSVIDFLVEGGIQLLDRSQEGATTNTFASRSHFQLSETCIRYLAMDEIQQRVSQSSEEDFIRNLYQFEFPFLAYSTAFWIEHAAKCEENNLSASQLLSYYDSLDLLHLRRHKGWPWGLWEFRSNQWPITTIHIASAYNLSRALYDILKQGVKANPRDGDGRTPLLVAVEKGHETVIRMLLERDDVDPDIVDKDGRTPLSWAAEKGREAVVRLLLERGDVDPNSVDKDGQMPLVNAFSGGHEAPSICSEPPSTLSGPTLSSSNSVAEFGGAAEEFASLLLTDEVLKPLYIVAQHRIGIERLERNIARLLRSYAKDLHVEATTELERTAVRFARRYAQPVAYHLCTHLDPSRNTRYLEMRLLSPEVPHNEERIEQYLEQIAKFDTRGDDTSGHIFDATNIVGDAVKPTHEHSDDSGSDEAERPGLSNLRYVEIFMTRSQAFAKLRENFRSFIAPVSEDIDEDEVNRETAGGQLATIPNSGGFKETTENQEEEVVTQELTGDDLQTIPYDDDHKITTESREGCADEELTEVRFKRLTNFDDLKDPTDINSTTTESSETQIPNIDLEPEESTKRPWYNRSCETLKEMMSLGAEFLGVRERPLKNGVTRVRWTCVSVLTGNKV